MSDGIECIHFTQELEKCMKAENLTKHQKNPAYINFYIRNAYVCLVN